MADNINPRLYARGYGSGSSSYAPAKDNGSCCPPVCADCGLLECLCRPRFFAGQLLTEQDLNRLDAYVRAKNRLHTLQLHGYGVVNGLEVRCEPCGSGVVVTTGYAISPCGDDIIVCCDTSVDVCALIKKCRPVDDTCRPFAGTAAKDCAELIEDWVLAIRYTENPARGVAALRMGPTCSCGASPGTCSCGQTQATCGCGKNSVSCRCGGKKNACGCGKPAASCNCGKKSTAKPRAMPAECEPTVLCEGYAFDVCLAPKKKPQDPRDENAITGAFWERFMCCINELGDTLPELPGPPTTQSFQQNPQAWNLWCCQTKQAMIAYFTDGPESDCTLAEQLSLVLCPDPTDQNFANEMLAVLTALAFPLLEAILACFCHSLLPPAPCGTTEDRIPLAVVRVRKRDCKVVSVCNFTPLRKTVLTFPTLAYWLSLIPLGSALSDLIHQLCCTPLFQRGDQPPDQPPPDPAIRAARNAERRDTTFSHANPTLSADVLARDQTFAALVRSAVARGTAPVDPKDIVGGLLRLDFGGTQPLSKEERANPPQFLLFNQVLRPIATSLLAAAPQLVRPAATPTSETDALKQRIAKLEEDIRKLQDRR
jgi:hypothetical protein